MNEILPTHLIANPGNVYGSKVLIGPGNNELRTFMSALWSLVVVVPGLDSYTLLPACSTQVYAH